MRVFLKKTFLFGVAIVLIVVFFFFINKALILNTGYTKVPSDINKIIVGASRTACGINDDLVDNTINISSNGDALFFSKIKIELLTKENHNIKTVVLSFDSRTLSTSTAENFYDSSSLKGRIPKYCYYFSLNDWKQMANINSIALVKNFFSIPKYSLKIAGGLNKKYKIKSLDLGEYYFFNRTITSNDIHQNSTREDIIDYTPSEIEIENLYKIVKHCDENEIRLILISPPIHKTIYSSSQYLKGQKWLLNFLKKDKKLSSIEYLDYSNVILEDKYYGDLIHLNNLGATIFSKKIDTILNHKK